MRRILLLLLLVIPMYGYAHGPVHTRSVTIAIGAPGFGFCYGCGPAIYPYYAPNYPRVIIQQPVVVSPTYVGQPTYILRQEGFSTIPDPPGSICTHEYITGPDGLQTHRRVCVRQ
jgi:hypothetical protein